MAVRKTITTCLRIPPRINSMGMWASTNMFTYSLPVLQMQMIFIFIITNLLHFLLRRLNLPKIVSEIIAGIILSSSLLGRSEKFRKLVFPADSQPILGTIALMGYTLFMFLIGVKMDLSMIKKTGRKALAIGILALLAPLMLGFATTFVLGELKATNGVTNLSYVTLIHSLTPFPVISCILSDLKIINSELGRLALSSAIVSDLFSVFLTTIGTISRFAKEESSRLAIIHLAATIAFILSLVYVFRPAMFWVVRQTPEGRPIKDKYIFTIIAGVLVSGVLSNWMGLFVLFGPFMLGLAVPDGPPLGSAIVDKLDSFVMGVLLPLFISTCAVRTNMATIDLEHPSVYSNGILSVVTMATKIAACMLPALYSKMPFNDSLALGLIMSAKGTVQLATYTLFRDNQTIDEETFALLALGTTVLAGGIHLAVKYLYNPSRKYAGYQKRNIMHSKHNAELRILACIHRSDNIASTINLLDASSPNRENPIGVYVLHLIELLGRASPLFISHQLQKKTVSNRSYSESVILAFSHYERNNRGNVSINAFTAISPSKLMHDDICILALDKLVSLIILPFHSKWAIEGSIEIEDHRLRTLNCSVLDTAPCSVGILVDRGHLGRSTSVVSSQSSYSVVMIFFGGSDDHEALTYAKRMAGNSKIRLTVVRFVAEDDDDGLSEWDKMLDAEVLKDVKVNNVNNRYVAYMEETVKDGPQTALIVRAMVDDYDLMIVGRRHNINSPQTSGLLEWSEFPELGAIGDLLASSDLKSKASVLVVQQQQQMS